MSGTTFIVAAYALTIVGTGVLVLTSFVAMRRAEAEADAVKRRR